MSYLPILISLLSLAVSCAAVYRASGSGFISVTKRQRSVESQMSDLQSSFDSLLESHKRLRSKIGMQELRAKSANEEKPEVDRSAPPPRGASKAELREYYGLNKPGFRVTG